MSELIKSLLYEKHDDAKSRPDIIERIGKKYKISLADAEYPGTYADLRVKASECRGRWELDHPEEMKTPSTGWTFPERRKQS
jgi:hypothetical protein